ncbi:hypothetical protein [Deinococcus sp.]|uniref:hypothetical protein n=1 Tax=Deinococcus sp. TaxID=47478 RepID=UPI003B5A7B1E
MTAPTGRVNGSARNEVIIGVWGVQRIGKEAQAGTERYGLYGIALIPVYARKNANIDVHRRE